MKINVDFSSLDVAARKMGAPEIDWSLDDITLDPLEKLRIALEAGIEVELSDVGTNAGDLLTYQGQHVLLYIKDHRQDVAKALYQGGAGRKFHVSECKTLKQMRRQGKIERYVATNNTSGKFLISGISEAGEEVEGEAELHVCQNCLALLNYKDFRQQTWGDRKKFVKKFSLDEYFENYSSYFTSLPLHTESTQPVAYGQGWEKISKDYRKHVGWKCEACGVDLGSHRHLLHVHHKNGINHDHHVDNLLALCSDCHSKQTGHQRMYVSRDARQLINRLRHQAGTKTVRKRSIKEQWKVATQLADPAVHGLLSMCQAASDTVPEIGYEAVRNDEIYAEVELAWPDQKLAVAIAADDGTKQMGKRGWTVLTPGQAMEEWFP